GNGQQGGKDNYSTASDASRPEDVLQDFCQQWARAKLEHLAEEFSKDLQLLEHDKMTDKQRKKVLHVEQEYGFHRKEVQKRGSLRWVLYCFPEQSDRGFRNTSTGSKFAFGPSAQRDLDHLPPELQHFAQEHGLLIDGETREVQWLYNET
ncbi:unnamed protein product, partial [Amoebophrya sp. A120]